MNIIEINRAQSYLSKILNNFKKYQNHRRNILNFAYNLRLEPHFVFHVDLLLALYHVQSMDDLFLVSITLMHAHESQRPMLNREEGRSFPILELCSQPQDGSIAAHSEG